MQVELTSSGDDGGTGGSLDVDGEVGSVGTMLRSLHRTHCTVRGPVAPATGVDAVSAGRVIARVITNCHQGAVPRAAVAANARGSKRRRLEGRGQGLPNATEG